MKFIRPDEVGDEFVTTREAAEMCGVGVATIRMWVHRGHLSRVAVLAVERAPSLYRRADVVACNEARTKSLARGVR